MFGQQSFVREVVGGGVMGSYSDFLAEVAVRRELEAGGCSCRPDVLFSPAGEGTVLCEVTHQTDCVRARSIADGELVVSEVRVG